MQVEVIRKKIDTERGYLSFFDEPISGFEPETPSLRVKCSTAELNRQTRLSYFVFSFGKYKNNFLPKAKVFGFPYIVFRFFTIFAISLTHKN